MKFPYIADELSGYSRIRVCCRFAACAFFLANVCCAMVSQTSGIPPKTFRDSAQIKSSDKALKTPAIADAINTNRAQSTLPHSNTTSTPATVTLKNGTLTVEANNSDLSQILKDVARVSGMIITGPISNARVFGTYGPRNPCEILTELLRGSGDNFIMMGVTREGTPRELLLTLQNGDSAPVTAPRQTVAAADHTDSSDMNSSEQEHLGPGAIAHVPPASPQDSQERSQQNLQRLQEMHNQLIRPQ